MRWRRAEPIQTVSALLAVGAHAVARAAAAMAGKPGLLRALPSACGEDWLAIFAAAPPGGDPIDDEDPDDGLVLPRLPGALPLHRAAAGWWLPVGVVLDAPEHAHVALWEALRATEGAATPAILVPRFGADTTSTDEADVYLVGERRPFTALPMAQTVLAAAGDGA